MDSSRDEVWELARAAHERGGSPGGKVSVYRNFWLAGYVHGTLDTFEMYNEAMDKAGPLGEEFAQEIKRQVVLERFVDGELYARWRRVAEAQYVLNKYTEESVEIPPT